MDSKRYGWLGHAAALAMYLVLVTVAVLARAPEGVLRGLLFALPGAIGLTAVVIVARAPRPVRTQRLGFAIGLTLSCHVAGWIALYQSSARNPLCQSCSTCCDGAGIALAMYPWLALIAVVAMVVVFFVLRGIAALVKRTV